MKGDFCKARLELDELKPECSLAFFLPVKGLVRLSERQYFAKFDLLVAPLEAECSLRAQNAEAFGEYLPEVSLEVAGEPPILGEGVGLLTYIDKVGRVEYHMSKPVVWIRHVASVCQHVWLYDKDSAVTEGLHATAAVLEDGERRFFVEPEHAGATAGI